MFGFLKQKKKAGKTDTKPSREDLIAQAKANAAAAREAIGEETLDKIAAAMRRKQESDLEKAKTKIRAMDQDKVADAVRLWLDEK
ncbi:MAG: hypothetical protein KDJ15_04040 [Alphaproteobacteria bacterium]|nr:hypothetical protein [Alphaproteobacteria bacterium]